jgi:hypothetical protein
MAIAQNSGLWSEWKEDVSAISWETGSIVAGVTALGAYSWDWGSSHKFKFNPEGWFGDNTSSGGADKLGHAFSSYAINNVLTDRLVRKGRPVEQAALSSVLTTQAIMLYVEVFDGFSNDHGFAREDVAMNLLGSGLSYVRAVNPKVRDLVDFRLEYQSSGYKGFRPLSDYAGQKYVMALKFSGFDALRLTPLRYLELQTGYYARGFSKFERDAGMDRSRQHFVGLGLNLGDILFGRRSQYENELRNAGRMFFEHIQMPKTAIRNDGGAAKFLDWFML